MLVVETWFRNKYCKTNPQFV